METPKPYNNRQVVDIDSSKERAQEAYKGYPLWINDIEKAHRITSLDKKHFHLKKECSDEPIDLTFTQKAPQGKTIKNDGNALEKTQDNENATSQPTDMSVFDEAASNTSLAIAKIMEADNFINMPKKYRKRKPDEEIASKMMNVNLNADPQALSCPEYVQRMDQKQTEVLKAAKSLFSKRTRTLYHWMYPNTPKSQLKAAVSMSWETLGNQEKEFYISQVLGRFGFPQNSLMINPQLDGIRIGPPLLQFDLAAQEERKNLIMQSWSSKMPRMAMAMHGCKKRGKLGRPPGNKKKMLREKESLMKEIQSENACDEFQDDPELSREFEQFKWTLHMNENKT